MLAIHQIAAGSTGETLDQVMDFLKVKSIDELNSLGSNLFDVVLSARSSSTGTKISSANGIWIEQSSMIKPSFEHAMQKFYRANIELVDFREKAEEVESEINSWVEKRTNGLIMNIIPPNTLSSETQGVLANCLHFMGAWITQFDESRTRDEDFYLLTGETVKVPLMHSYSDEVIGVFDEFQILKLPFEYDDYDCNHNKMYSMYFLLPNERGGLPKLFEKVTSEAGFLDSHLPRKCVEVKVIAILKFEILVHFEASGILKNLGLVLPFEDGDGDKEGGLTGMVNSRLYVSRILHKCVIKVNEEGCEVSAATVGDEAMGYSVFPERNPEVEFVADHPFMFLLREDKSGTILFMGQVLDPSVGV